MKKVSLKSKALLSGLLDYIDEIGEQNLLSEVSKSLEKEIKKKEGSDEIIVLSAVKLSPSQQARIKIILQKKFEVNLPIINIIDTRLIGGFTIRVNDWFLDSSVSHEIELLRRSLLS